MMLAAVIASVKKFGLESMVTAIISVFVAIIAIDAVSSYIVSVFAGSAFHIEVVSVIMLCTATAALYAVNLFAVYNVDELFGIIVAAVLVLFGFVIVFKLLSSAFKAFVYRISVCIKASKKSDFLSSCNISITVAFAVSKGFKSSK